MLDMNKKAVKEAFRFTRFIPIPTLSTFNMLMSVCGSSQDSEGAFQVLLQHVEEADLKADCKLYTTLISTCAKSVHIFMSALIDVAGHAGKVDTAFEILQEARAKGTHVGIISYSSLMGACSNVCAGRWQKAVGLYGDIKNLNLNPTIPMMNALITSLCKLIPAASQQNTFLQNCDADQLQKATKILFEIKGMGLCPNTITYSFLAVASEKKDDLEAVTISHIGST
ncbi:hypothetical protein OROMI_033080 [Orobanche minor]